MKRLIFVSLFSLLLLLSCTVLESTQRPSWIDSVPEIPGEKVFIGHGKGGTEVGARSDAVLDALSQMEKEIGYSLESTYFRELFSSKSIADLGARLADEFSWEIDGEWNVYVAVTAEEEVFDSARSPEYFEIQRREEKISSLLSSSMDAYKDNKDIKAAEDILSALLVSLEGEVWSEEYRSENLLEKALEYLSRIRIESVKPSKDTPSSSLEFRVVRTKGLMYPVVEDGIIECRYEALTTEGEIQTLSHLARTNGKGRLVVNRTNPYALHSGIMTFRVHIDDDLMFNLSLKAPKEMVDRIKSVIDDGVLEYYYSFVPRKDTSSVLVALGEYNLDGSLRGEDGVLKSILERTFSSQEIELENIVYVEGEEESDNIEALLAQYSHMDRIYIIRLGVVSRVEIGELWYSRTEGRIIALSPRSGEREDMTSFHFVDSGKTGKEADDNALLALCEIICGFLLGEF